jgi:hypothetical protein
MAVKPTSETTGLQVGPAIHQADSTSEPIIRVRVAGDTFDRLTINADGSINFGSGSAALDTTLSRGSAAGKIAVNGVDVTVP